MTDRPARRSDRPPSLGPREAGIMRLLWREPERFFSVRQVGARLDADLAYTTVMTLLTRLHGKGVLERRADGRAWTYRPLISQGEYAAATMAAVLEASDDHAAALLHFVERLSPEEQRELRRRLEEDGGR